MREGGRLFFSDGIVHICGRVAPINTQRTVLVDFVCVCVCFHLCRQGKGGLAREAWLWRFGTDIVANLIARSSVHYPPSPGVRQK